MNGGYFAIKGFEFQIDKTILEIFEADNENKNISLEQIQDVNTSDYVMQIKYKETQKYETYKVREPIIQLIEEFRTNKIIKYYLYCHFSDKAEKKTTLSLLELEEILKVTIKKNSSKKLKAIKHKIDSFSTSEKTSFLKNFNLIFAPKFQTQFEAIISKIKGLSFCRTDDEAIFYYSNITDYLRKLVINNSVFNRRCSRREILNYLKDGRKMVFTSAFVDYKGEVQYLKYLKDNFIKPLKNQDNFIFIGCIQDEKELKISDLIANLVTKQYDKATYDIKPLTFIVPDDKVTNIKKELLDNKVFFNDGCESIKFTSELFFQSPIINRKIYAGKATESLGKTSFKLRIVSKSAFEIHYNNEINPSKIYYFSDELSPKLRDHSFIKVDIINTMQIQNLFNT